LIDSNALVVLLQLDDSALAQRVGVLLEQVSGLRLAVDGEPADIIVAAAPRERDRNAADAELTPRELEVLGLLAEGASNKVIARRLGVSVHTAKFHVGRLLDKLDAVGRTDAVAHAARLGVIHL
jgi:DNA-binding CsgD family transcriptional regulator